MSIDSDLRHSSPLDAQVSAAGLGRELRRAGIAPWTLWIGYLSLGGVMSFTEVSEAINGMRPVSTDELYLLVQARNF